jgi:ATP-dependent DNA ligase
MLRVTAAPSEGIVSKRATSRYKSGRCDAWRKVKNPKYERRSSASGA